MIVRKAIPKDFEAVREIDREFFVWACKINPWLDPDYVKVRHGPDFRKSFFDRKEVFFVAEDDGKIVGYSEGIIENLPSPFKNKKVGVLESLYIIKEYRSQGLGERLSREVLKWLKSRGIKEYKLTVHHANATAYRLYKKMGFKDYFWSLRM